VKIPRAFLEQMVAQAQSEAPLEACGLLAGRDERATHILPVSNVLHSPVKYRMDGQEFADAMTACDFQPLAIYHSHPQGPPVPSPTDIAEAFYPDSVHIILSLASLAEPPSVRAFRIVSGVVTEVELQVE
jgi:proteasome lid subunit RPN8/RPN11